MTQRGMACLPFVCLRHYILQASHCPESLPHSWVCIHGRNYRKAREVWQRPKQATIWIEPHTAKAHDPLWGLVRINTSLVNPRISHRAAALRSVNRREAWVPYTENPVDSLLRGGPGPVACLMLTYTEVGKKIAPGCNILVLRARRRQRAKGK